MCYKIGANLVRIISGSKTCHVVRCNRKKNDVNLVRIACRKKNATSFLYSYKIWMRPVRLPLILNFRPTKINMAPTNPACPIYFGMILPQSSYFLLLFGRFLPQSSYFLLLSFLSPSSLFIKHVMNFICQPLTFQVITLYFRSLSFLGPSFFVSQWDIHALFFA